MRQTTLILAMGMAGLAAADCSSAEVDVRVTPGYAHVVDGHAAIGVSVRIRGARFFVEPEYLYLRGPGTDVDRGPVVHIGFLGRDEKNTRPHVAVGYGPVSGPAGDKGLLCLSVGITGYLSSARRVFLVPEVRIGALGSSGYLQVALAVGISRRRK